MSGSGFYTNRIRFSEMLNLFKNTGFAVEATYVTRWAALPTPQSKVWSGFRDLPEDELRVSGFQAILSPA